MLLNAVFSNTASATLLSTLTSLSLPWYRDHTQPLSLVNKWTEYEFVTTALPHNHKMEVSLDGDPPAEDRPASSMPLILLQSLFRAIGIDDGFKEIQINTRRVQGPYLNPLAVVSADSTSPIPHKARDLCFENMDFKEALVTNCFDWLDLQSVEYLSMNECDHPEVLFHLLIQNKAKINLKWFRMENWLIKPELIKKSPSNIEAFLSAFSGLEYCTILLTKNWKPDFKTMFRKHSTLKDLVISLGRDNILYPMLTKLVNLCPNLTHLGFQNDVFETPHKRGTFVDGLCPRTCSLLTGFDTVFLPFADNLVEFEKLVSLEAVDSAEDRASTVLNYNPLWRPDDFDDRHEYADRMTTAYEIIAWRILRHFEAAVCRAIPGNFRKLNKVIFFDRAFPEEDTNFHTYHYDIPKSAYTERVDF
jgi:hypothetical protein